MADLKAEIKNGKLIIEIPVVNPPIASKSGKSLIVASTNGNLVTDLMVGGKPVTIGLNAYTKL